MRNKSELYKNINIKNWSASNTLKLNICLDTIEKAQQEISNICKGKKFIISIPANENTDSDIIISNALTLSKELIIEYKEKFDFEIKKLNKKKNIIDDIKNKLLSSKTVSEYLFYKKLLDFFEEN